MIDAQNKTTTLYKYQSGIGANTEAILNRLLRHILYGDEYPPTPFEATVFNANYPNSAYNFNGGYSWDSAESPTLIVDWGDGSPVETITAGGSFTHAYATPQQTHRIKLWLGKSSRLTELYFYDTQIVHTFGDGEINAFIFESAHVTQVPEQLPSYVTGTYLMFKNANTFNQNISMWDTRNVTNMNDMFSGAAAFNQDISGWKVGSVTKMNSMFRNAEAFNQDLSRWCVTNITAQPTNFDLNATSWTLPRPVWGTCPAP